MLKRRIRFPRMANYSRSVVAKTELSVFNRFSKKRGGNPRNFSPAPDLISTDETWCVHVQPLA